MLYKSNDTGDYMTPCIIPARCIITARDRESGKVEHIEPKDVHRSAIIEYPALFWFATGENPDTYVYPPNKKKETRPPLSPPAAEPSHLPIRESSKARGSTDPLIPRDDSSRSTGAGNEKISLKEAPWRKTASWRAMSSVMVAARLGSWRTSADTPPAVAFPARRGQRGQPRALRGDIC